MPDEGVWIGAFVAIALFTGGAVLTVEFGRIVMSLGMLAMALMAPGFIAYQVVNADAA